MALRPMMLKIGMLAATLALAVAAPIAAAKAKKSRKRSGAAPPVRVMIFSSERAQDPPTVAYDEQALAKGFEPAVLFTEVKVTQDSSAADGDVVEVKEQTVTTDAPAQDEPKLKSKRKKSKKK